MKKILGITVLLVVICVFTALRNENFLSAYNVQNTIRWTALYGIISIGVAFVIISGGIDLSIGSVVGLIGSLLAWFLTEKALCCRCPVRSGEKKVVNGGETLPLARQIETSKLMAA